MENLHKNIIITGGAGLLGFSVAKTLIQNNYNCLLADINEQSLKKAHKDLSFLHKGKVEYCICDITSSSEIDKLLEVSKNFFGGFHGAVHCAYPKPINWGKKFEDLSEIDLNQSLSMQLGSAIIFSQKIIEYFLKNRGGNLIHISSIQGICPPKFEHYEGTDMYSPIEYSAIKAGVIAITTWLAKRYKNSNIRVNCISPGGILDSQPLSFLEKYRASCSNIGMLDPKDVASAVEFILNDSSRAINGQNLIIDDGWSL